MQSPWFLKVRGVLNVCQFPFLHPQNMGTGIEAGTASVVASIYRAFRQPTLNELYRSFRVGDVLTFANENLRAERLTGGEFGVNANSFKRRLDTRAVFWTELATRRQRHAQHDARLTARRPSATFYVAMNEAGYVLHASVAKNISERDKAVSSSSLRGQAVQAGGVMESNIRRLRVSKCFRGELIIGACQYVRCLTLCILRSAPFSF